MAALPTSLETALHELHLKQTIQPRLSGPQPLKIIRYKRIASTNTKAKTLANRGAAGWTVIAAEVQTRGRGRSGRTWESPKGGLWFSLIIRPRMTVDRIPLLQFWIANALRKGIEEVYRVKSEAKWPNDLVVDGQKLAGILIETKVSGSNLSYAVIGIGLNVNLAGEELPTGASSILLKRKERFGLEKTLGSILRILEGRYDTLNDERSVIADWWEHCAHRMKSVMVDTNNGSVGGKCVGVNPDGSIIIQTDHGNITVPDGTLRLDV